MRRSRRPVVQLPQLPVRHSRRIQRTRAPPRNLPVVAILERIASRLYRAYFETCLGTATTLLVKPYRMLPRRPSEHAVPVRWSHRCRGKRHREKCVMDESGSHHSTFPKNLLVDLVTQRKELLLHQKESPIASYIRISDRPVPNQHRMVLLLSSKRSLPIERFR
jgi:hypothetical protein